MQESQYSFNGGLNTRQPSHLIAEDQSPYLKNVDVSFNDLRGERGLGLGGQSEFFYEAGNSWISQDGFESADVINDWPSNFSTDANPAVTRTITENINYFSGEGGTNAIIGDGVTLNVGQFTITGQINANANTLTTTNTADLKIGNEIIHSSYLPTGTKITAIDAVNGTITLNNQAHTNSPNNTTFTVDAIVTLYGSTSGIQGVNSFVEYNKDLYLSRSNFTVQATATASSKIITLTADIYKCQLGDVVSNASYLNEGTYIVKINSANNTLELNEEAIATAGSQQEFTIKPIISKFMDGDTNEALRASAPTPEPSFSFEQKTALGTQTERATAHSSGWYSTNAAIPFQYGLSYYDQTGVESGVSDFTDSTIGKPGGSKFTSNNNLPMYLSIDSVNKYSGSNPNYGRFALYRVGGSSAIKKRCANLFLSDLSVSATPSTSGTNHPKITISLSSAINSNLYKVKWYSYKPSGTVTGYKYYNSNTGYTNPYDSTPSTTFIYGVSGETEYLNPSGGNLSFELLASQNAHYVDFLIFMKIPDETVEREYVCRGLSVHNSIGTSVGYDFVDWIASDGLTDIQPIDGDVSPARGLSMLTEVSNIFYGVIDNRLYASEYGNPNQWPEYGYIDFDQPITALGRFSSELIVFTSSEMYRVFGTSALSLRKVPVPATEGVPLGLDGCVKKTQGGLMFVSNDGVCLYNGQNVVNLTNINLSEFTLPNTVNSNNTAGHRDNIYYLFGSDSTDEGYKIDLKYNARMTRTSQYGSSLFYRGTDNQLYSNAGIVDYSSNSRQPFTALTRKFVNNNYEQEKYYSGAKIVATNFKGSVEIHVDGTLVQSFSIPTVVSDFHRTLYLNTPSQGNGAQIKYVDCEGEVLESTIIFTPGSEIINSLFSSVLIKYIGTPTIKVLVDGTEKISSTTLQAFSGTIGQSTLYFPAMTTGLIPHLIETNNESNGRILDISYQATGV